MAQVGVAPAALYLRPGHAVAGVRFRLDGLLGRRGIETRPPGARVVFGIRTKQGLSAADTLVDPRGLGVLVFAREGRFRSLLAGHIVLIRRELFLPGGFVFADLVFHRSPPTSLNFGLCLALLGYQIRCNGLTIRPKSPGVSLH